MNQVKTNAEALILPMQDKRYSYHQSPISAINNAAAFHRSLAYAMDIASNQGKLNFVSETTVGNSKNQSYRTFKDEKGLLHDFPLNRLAAQHWNCDRIRTPEGEIIKDYSGLK